MVTSTLRKVGECFQITIPEEEVRRLGLEDGQKVSVALQATDDTGKMRPEVREAFEASWKRNEAGYRYLAGR